jgi:hypothetical protein
VGADRPQCSLFTSDVNNTRNSYTLFVFLLHPFYSFLLATYTISNKTLVSSPTLKSDSQRLHSPGPPVPPLRLQLDHHISNHDNSVRNDEEYSPSPRQHVAVPGNKCQGGKQKSQQPNTTDTKRGGKRQRVWLLSLRHDIRARDADA